MLGKIRIYDLARELGLPAKAALEELRALGIRAKSHSNTIDQTDADLLRRKIASVAPAKKEKGKTKTQRAKPSPGKPAKAVGAAKPKTSPAKPKAKPKKVSAPKAKAAAEPPEPPPASAESPKPREAPKAAEAEKPKGVVIPMPKPKAKAPRKKTEETEEAVQEEAVQEKEPAVAAELKPIYLSEGATVKEIAERMEVKTKDVLASLMRRGVLAHINRTLDTKTAAAVAKEFGFLAQTLSYEEMTARAHTEAAESAPSKPLPLRAPIVTVMGHVDHGKTKLLDAIRQTNVVSEEAGGITQHIGAYRVTTRNRKDGSERTVVFLDTPGHEAFTRMRARGASVTDVVVLVVAADDGVKPQTLEALSHARSANVPIVVAVNKIDKAGADPQRVRSQLAEHGLSPEEWGGDTVMVNVSALKKEGIDDLLEMLVLVADLKELRANSDLAASGTVIEAHVERGHGQVANILVQQGTLHKGDAFIAGTAHGRVRALLDDRGDFIKEAGPSTPVEVLGLNGLPEAGDRFQVVEDDKEARRVATLRVERARAEKLGAMERLTLDSLSRQIEKGEIQELPLVLKCDVKGSFEVLSDRLQKLSTEKVRVNIVHGGLGAITEGDILLAEATNAVVLGFHVRPESKASDTAQRQSVEVRTFDVIYELTEAVESAMLGLLKPSRREVVLGHAEVRQTFKISKAGTVAGCFVASGIIPRSADVKLFRQNVLIYEGQISSLKRFKDDAKEVKAGLECGIGVANFNDIKVGDIIEAFREEIVQLS
jgi:translation initiation factor IF-2